MGALGVMTGALFTPNYGVNEMDRAKNEVYRGPKRSH